MNGTEGTTSVHEAYLQPVRADVGALGQLVGGAFHELEASRFLEPDPERRKVVLRSYFEYAVRDAASDGAVYSLGAEAVALWMPVGPDGLGPVALDERLAALDPGLAERDRVFHEVLHARHPLGLGVYHWLMILAVNPELQGRGLGSALLTAHHAHLDRLGLPGYLEAASLQARALYERHGYTDTPGGPITLPDGARMYPMLRRPHTD